MQLDSNCTTTLRRRGIAYTKLGEFSKAKADLYEVASMSPEKDPKVSRGIANLKIAMQESERIKTKEKRIATKVVSHCGDLYADKHEVVENQSTVQVYDAVRSWIIWLYDMTLHVLGYAPSKAKSS